MTASPKAKANGPNEAKESNEARGGCLCGAVRFTGQGPFLFCAHCHCHWCRRAHGAAFVTWLGVRDTSFALSSGASDLRWFASSEQSERGFCTKCGTTLFFRSTLAAGEVHVALACVESDLIPIPMNPQSHVFYDARVPWIVMGDDLPKLDRDHAGIKKYQAIAKSPDPKR
jgi:hypothetical protein